MRATIQTNYNSYYRTATWTHGQFRKQSLLDRDSPMERPLLQRLGAGTPPFSRRRERIHPSGFGIPPPKANPLRRHRIKMESVPWPFDPNAIYSLLCQM